MCLWKKYIFSKSTHCAGFCPSSFSQVVPLENLVPWVKRWHWQKYINKWNKNWIAHPLNPAVSAAVSVFLPQSNEVFSSYTFLRSKSSIFKSSTFSGFPQGSRVSPSFSHPDDKQNQNIIKITYFIIGILKWTVSLHSLSVSGAGAQASMSFFYLLSHDKLALHDWILDVTACGPTSSSALRDCTRSLYHRVCLESCILFTCSFHSYLDNTETKGRYTGSINSETIIALFNRLTG